MAKTATTPETGLNTPQAAGLSTQAAMPDWMKSQAANLGNENVSNEDLVIPRLAIIQSQSPELDADDPKYIEGAKQGQMFNTLTRALYDAIYLVDCFFRKEYAVFVKRTEGGGFRGSFPTEKEAVQYVAGSEDAQKLEVTETAIHFCLAVNPDTGSVLGEVAVPMTSTKLKVSRNWNSMIRMRGGDRFAGIWKMVTKKEKNDKGSFFNYNVSPGPWVSEAIYEAAKATYESIQSGMKDIDRTDSDSTTVTVEPPSAEERF